MQIQLVSNNLVATMDIPAIKDRIKTILGGGTETNGIPDSDWGWRLTCNSQELNLEFTNPTMETVDNIVAVKAVAAEALLAGLKARLHIELNAECQRRIFAKYPLTKQINIINGVIIDLAYEQTMKDEIAVMLAICNNVTDVLIPAATTETEIEAIKSRIVWTI